MIAVDLSRGESLLSSKLANSVEALLPDLRQGVNILVEGSITHHQKPEDVLRGFVCGRAVRLLGYQLRQEGYDARGYANEYLDNDGNYPSRSHALLVVKNPESDDDVIVDAAYSQFLTGLILEDEFIPKEEVIIFPKSHIGSLALSLVKLRNEKLERHGQPEVLARRSSLFELSDEGLAKHFTRIWETDSYKPIKGSLEEDIRNYRAGQSVSTLTRNLIETMSL